MTKTSDSYDIAKIVADAPWFQNIPKEGREKLIQASHIKHFTARQYLYQVGETTASIYCLLSGRLRISMTSELGQAFAVTDLEPPIGWAIFRYYRKRVESKKHRFKSLRTFCLFHDPPCLK